MPVLGSSGSSSASGVIKQGIIIPSGSLDIWRAARDASKTGTLTEVACFGDSTSYGAADVSRGPSFYSWIRKLRALALAAGFPDGGYGYVHPDDLRFGSVASFQDADGYPTVTQNSGTWTAASATLAGYASTSGNGTDSITVAGKGTAVRLVYGRGSQTGKITYSVDGGAPTTVDTLTPVGAKNVYDATPVIISGLTEGAHSLTVTSAGKASIRQPARLAGPNQNAGGSLTAGTTYYYWMTVTSANGESLPVSIGSITVVNGQQTVSCQLTADYGHTGMNLYRATTNSSAASGLVKTGSFAGQPGGAMTLSDDGTVTPTGAPPTTSTLGTLATGTNAEFWCEFIRPNTGGLVFHRDSYNGATTNTFFDSISSQATTIAQYAVRLGLKSVNQATSVNGYMNGTPTGATPLYRNVKLALFQIGTNNGQGQATDATGTKNVQYIEDLALFCRTARAAGASVVCISPPYTAATDPLDQMYAGRFKRECMDAALSHGAAYVDFQEAVGWDIANWPAKGYGSGAFAFPHLGQAAYDAEATFLWNNVLAV